MIWALSPSYISPLLCCILYSKDVLLKLAAQTCNAWKSYHVQRLQGLKGGSPNPILLSLWLSDLFSNVRRWRGTKWDESWRIHVGPFLHLWGNKAKKTGKRQRLAPFFSCVSCQWIFAGLVSGLIYFGRHKLMPMGTAQFYMYQGLGRVQWPASLWFYLGSWDGPVLTGIFIHRVTLEKKFNHAYRISWNWIPNCFKCPWKINKI